MAGDPVDKGRMLWIGTATVPLTFIRTSDLATYLAAAVDAEAEAGERIDIKVWPVPAPVTGLGLSLQEIDHVE